MRILLIEDNQSLCQTLARHIIKAGYMLDYTYDGKEGLDFIRTHSYDLIILDCMLPSLSGLNLLKCIRKEGIHTSVIMTTALNDVDDRVNGLDAGADDYLTKPFAIEELLARIRALSRRPVKWVNHNCLSLGDISYDAQELVLSGPKHHCTLSKREGSLLELFLQNPNQVLPRAVIFGRIWGPDAAVEESNIDNYIRFLRRRLTSVGSQLILRTIRSVGYVLEGKNV